MGAGAGNAQFGSCIRNPDLWLSAEQNDESECVVHRTQATGQMLGRLLG